MKIVFHLKISFASLFLVLLCLALLCSLISGGKGERKKIRLAISFY